MVTAAHRGHTVVPVSYKQGTHIDGGVGGERDFHRFGDKALAFPDALD